MSRTIYLRGFEDCMGQTVEPLQAEILRLEHELA